MRRVLLLFAGLLLLLGLAVPAGALYYALFTEDGLRFLIDHAPRHIGDIQVDIAGASGTVSNGIRVQSVDVDHHLVHVRVEDIQARVRLLPLLWQTLRCPDVHAARVDVLIKPRTRPRRPGEPVFLPRWLMISAEHARVDHALLRLPSGARFDATTLSAAAIVRHKQIRFFSAQMDSGLAHYEAIGELRAADPLRIAAEGRMLIRPEGQPAWTLTATGHGDLDELRIVGRVESPFRAALEGRAKGLGGHFHWSGTARLHDLDVAAWGGSKVLGPMAGTLALQGDTSGFGAAGTLEPPGLHAGPFHVEYEGSWSGRTLIAHHLAVQHPGSGASATGSGQFEFVPHGPRLQLAGTWRDFRWPLAASTPALHSEAGEFRLSGTLPYAVHLKGVGHALDLSSMAVELDGTLGRQAFSFDRATAELLGGRGVDLSGELRWAPHPQWTLAGRFSALETARWRADLPGHIGFDLRASGTGFGTADDFALAFAGISGRVRGLTARGDGRVLREHGAWRFEGVRLGLGEASAELDGRFGRQVDLRFVLAANDLAVLAPDSRGQIRASGVVRGSAANPLLKLSAHGSGLRHAGLEVGRLDADVDLDPGSSRAARSEVHVTDLTVQGQRIHSLSLTADGPPEHLGLQAELRSSGLRASARASGPWQNGGFRGRLEALTLESGSALQLALKRPVGLALSAAGLRLEWMCLGGKPAGLCADADWSPGHWSATVTATELPLSTLTAGSDPRIRYFGNINVLGRVLGGGAAPLEGTVRVEVGEAGFEHQLPSRRVEHVRFGSGSIVAAASRGYLSVNALLGSGGVGTFKLDLSARRESADWRALPLQGELHAHTDQLGLLSLYVPDIDRASGRLAADLRIGGTVGAPTVLGGVGVEDAELDFYQVNLAVRALRFDAALTENGLDFRGRARLGSGEASASGQLAWRDALPHGTLRLLGTGLRVVDIPEAQIDASPDLSFSVDGRRVEVTGTVQVPYARIVPEDLAGAVRPSSDEVLVGEETRESARRFEVMSAVTLTLGDQVSIETRGLSGGLAGSINVKSGYEAITRATGELSIVKGKYTAYAHNMDIERGRLIFTGGSVDDPGIDIRAARRFPDVKAGVNVRGTLQQPRISFFSEPSLPQSQIASLLLSGSLETAQTRQGGAGNTALVQGGAILAQQLGSRVGIQDVGVQSDLLTNNTSLVLGRYLSPRFYVSYGISLTQTLNVLKLRYSLGDHWTISTEVGQARGADLVFSILK